MLVITFRVSEARYAIPCRSIIEVIPLVTLQELPHAPACLLGTFVYRGHLTPVLDLCQLIGKYPCARRLSSRVVLADCALPDGSNLRAGLLAEHMTEARRLITAPVAGVPSAATPYLGEVVLEAGSPLQLLNVNRILLGSNSAVARHFSPERLGAGVTDREPAQP